MRRGVVAVLLQGLKVTHYRAFENIVLLVEINSQKHHPLFQLHHLTSLHAFHTAPCPPASLSTCLPRHLCRHTAPTPPHSTASLACHAAYSPGRSSNWRQPPSQQPCATITSFSSTAIPSVHAHTRRRLLTLQPHAMITSSASTASPSVSPRTRPTPRRGQQPVPHFDDSQVLSPKEGSEYLVAAAYSQVPRAKLSCKIAMQVVASEQVYRLKSFDLCRTVWAVARLVNDGVLSHMSTNKVVGALMKAVEEVATAQLDKIAWDASSKRWNSMDLSQLMYGFACVGYQPTQAFMEQVLDRCHVVLSTFNAQDISNLLYALAKLNTPKAPFPEHLLYPLAQHAAQCMGDMVPQGIANTLWAIAKLNCPLPSELLGSDSEIVRTVQPLLEEFKAQEASNLIWSLARLQAHISSEFIAEFLDAITPKLSAFTPQGYANVMYALAVLGNPLPSSFLDSCLVAAGKKLDTFQCIDFAQFAWALAEMKCAVPDDFARDLLDAAHKKLSTFTPQERVTMLGSITNWECRVVKESEFVLDLLTAAHQSLIHLTAQEVSSLVFHLAKLEYLVPHAFLVDLTSCVRPRLAEFGPRPLSQLVWSLARLRHKVGSSFMTDVCTTARTQLSAFQPLDWVQFSWALAKVKCQLPSGFTRDMADAVHCKLNKFSGSEIGELMWALGTLKCSLSDAFLTALMDETWPRLNEFDPKDYGKLLWGLANAKCEVLGVTGGVDYVIHVLDAAHAKRGVFRPKDVLRLSEALVALEFDVPEDLSAIFECLMEDVDSVIERGS